ncbi:MAG TPA: acetyl-CoA C-acyltransferase, partial [Gemmatimonadales bacterium]|nr:acetyl-CoA C-acyltransferase [Gemmatimonadales bacterium]
VLAGGAESLSDIPILHSRRMTQVLVAASKAKSLGERIRIFASVRPRDLVPVSPAIAEPSTGESMGQSAEKMAKENGISRDAQDRFTLMSHQRAAAGTADGRLTAEIAPWFGGPGLDQVTASDNGIRTDTTLDALAQLRPVFDRRYGSVTAGNSSPLTDGAAAVLLVEQAKARALGLRPLTTIRSYAVAAVDPGWQLLMGPAWAVPLALQRARIGWGDLGLLEIHEAFAAQVLSNAQAWSSRAWAARVGRSDPLGEVDWERANVMGGSIAIGHPFGATGARLVTTLSNEMVRRGVQFGLISICAQGGMGFAMVLENVSP